MEAYDIWMAIEDVALATCDERLFWQVDDHYAHFTYDEVSN